MTHFFKPLDLTVNGEAKRFMKDKFTTWYPEEVHKQINPGNGDANGEVNVDLRLGSLSTRTLQGDVVVKSAKAWFLRRRSRAKI